MSSAVQRPELLFRLYRVIETSGNPSPSLALPLADEVISTANNGTGTGDFWIKSPVDRFLNGCTEAAYAISLHVHAKATSGDGYRIMQYDASDLRAFALAEQ